MFSKDKYLVISILFALITIPTCFVLSENMDIDSNSDDPQQNLIDNSQIDSINPNIISKTIKLFDSTTSLWTDINYSDKSRTNWDPTNHIKRIKTLAIDYNQHNEHTQDISIINKGLRVWFERDFTCPNSFINLVTINRYLLDILILSENIIDKDNLSNISQRIINIDPKITIGVNRIYLASILLKYGIYKNDSSLINRNKKIIADEIFVSNNFNNLQPDYSYHFHNARIQMYAYGKGFLETCIGALALVSNTNYAFDQDKIAIIRNFILEGWQWLARGSFTVPSSQDRSSSRKDGLTAPNIISSLEKMKAIDTVYANQYQSIIEQQQDISKFKLNGTKTFPFSDIGVTHSKNASFFIKVLSDRNLPTQSINSENLKGKYLHFGNHFIIQDGQEYSNLMGAWDWNLLPGFSYIKDADTILRNPATGVANFNQTIVANMVFNYQNDAGTTLTNLYKIWVLQKDRLICLISSPDKNFNGEVITSLDQTKFRNNAFINTQKISNQEQSNQLQKNQWLYHNHLVYYSPNSDAIQYQIKNSLNDWKSINDRYRKDNGTLQSVTLFTPTITQTNNSISYSILYVDTVPNVATKLIQNSYTVAQNDLNAQVVYLNSDSSYCGAIHQNNYTLKINTKLNLSSSIPILFLIKNNSIFVTEPTLNSKSVALKINNKTYKIQLDNVGQGNLSFKN